MMRGCIYHHRKQRLPIRQSASKVVHELVPFWEKSRLPKQQNYHIIKKITDLYAIHVRLMKNRSRLNMNDESRRFKFTTTMDKLFYISHANSDHLIKNEEDRRFLAIQRESLTQGSFGPMDRNLAETEQRAAERNTRFTERLSTLTRQTAISRDEHGGTVYTSSNSNDSDDEPLASLVSAKQPIRRKRIISESVTAVLDRTNTSIRKSTMLIASVLNEAGCSSASAVLSKSTIHRRRQRCRSESARQIKQNYTAAKCVVHWDGKTLPDVSGDPMEENDRLAVLASSLIDGKTKLLSIPKLPSGTGQITADAVFEIVKSWDLDTHVIDTHVIGMCFDTTASNTGRIHGACVLLEQLIGRNLLWMACRHHIFEVLLSDVFTICLGPSTGPEILFFKRLRDHWGKLQHRPKQQLTPLILASDSLKQFILTQLTIVQPRADYKEFLQLAAQRIGLEIHAPIRKPGAIHRAR